MFCTALTWVAADSKAGISRRGAGDGLIVPTLAIELRISGMWVMA